PRSAGAPTPSGRGSGRTRSRKGGRAPAGRRPPWTRGAITRRVMFVNPRRTLSSRDCLPHRHLRLESGDVVHPLGHASICLFGGPPSPYEYLPTAPARTHPPREFCVVRAPEGPDLKPDKA